MGTSHKAAIKVSDVALARGVVGGKPPLMFFQRDFMLQKGQTRRVTDVTAEFVVNGRKLVFVPVISFNNEVIFSLSERHSDEQVYKYADQAFKSLSPRASCCFCS